MPKFAYTERKHATRCYLEMPKIINGFSEILQGNGFD